MATPPSAPSGPARRRSQRVFIQTKVSVYGQVTGRDFHEDTITLAVNAHGGLVLLTNPVSHGQRLVLTNVVTSEDIECRVVFLGPRQGEAVQIGVEFLKPSPNFWRISFPPEDWKASV